MLVVRNKKLPVSEYWSTDICSPILREISPKNRFNLFMSMLHFCNNEKQPEGDKLFKISKINSVIRAKFAEAFLPFRNLHMRKQLSFRSKNCNPRNQLITLRLFVLCDLETRLVLDFVVQNTALQSKEEMERRQCMLHQGHNLYTDNLYNSSPHSLFD